MSKAILMVGLQGAGKSTKAQELAKQYNATILSSDCIRAEFNNNISNDKVFTLLHKRAKAFLADSQNIIIDATNTTRKSRAGAINSLKSDGVDMVAYVMTTPYRICEQRLNQRNALGGRQVPLEALNRYYKSFEIPFYEEGFAEIIIDEWSYPMTRNEANENALRTIMDNFDQKNKWHKLTVGEHCELCCHNLALKTDNLILIEAAYWHDIGKVFSQSFDDEGNGHYYSHANIGTYNLLQNLDVFNFWFVWDVLDCLFYINYHMLVFDWKEEKTLNKWKRIFGKTKFNNLLLLNKADKASRGGANED